MKQKRVFSTELAYVVGIVTVALGAALTAKADFGMSMVVAPAYLLHLKLSQIWPFFSFGMAEYSLQAVLLIVMSLILRRFRPGFLFAFVTAVVYGFTLDGCMWLVGLLPWLGIPARVAYFVVGTVLCSVGVSAMFHTYLPPEVYELFVKEISAKYRTDIHKTKTVYDICSCLIAVILSFAFFGFGHFEGVKLGTIVCALVNGWLIGLVSHWYEKHFEFRDLLPWRESFTI